MHHLLFAPLFSIGFLIVLFFLALILVLFPFIQHKKGSLWRFLAFLFFVIVFFRPYFQIEHREAIKNTIALVIDRSPSQKLEKRAQDTDKAVALLKEKFKKLKNIQLRCIEAGNSNGGEDSASFLFTALEKNLADLPSAQIGGAIFITDGQIHDIPKNISDLGFSAPINALITGNPEGFDRKIRFLSVPKFGFVKQPLQLSFIVEDEKAKADSKIVSNRQALAALTINGEEVESKQVIIGEKNTFTFLTPHTGKNLVQISTPLISDELSTLNNSDIASVNGLRQNLHVLLISGEPSNGERNWRDLLKSDPSVQFVHFNVLRSLEKVDDTPIADLSLVVFPTTDLFMHKIQNFDLVIFDRYQDYHTFPNSYYANIARYVRNGGALLMITGPEFTSPTSLTTTPLDDVLPAIPTGKILEKEFLPQITELGTRHPITRPLLLHPKWGAWLRQIEVTTRHNAQTLMKGIDGKPLLILSHEDKGRVGLLLSDETWLWARGYQGGGPYSLLYRQIAHWLMKDLEEEQLTSQIENNTLHISRSSLASSLPPVLITSPSGKVEHLTLQKNQNGFFTGDLKIHEAGLFKITQGTLSCFAYNNGQNIAEFTDVVASADKLRPIVEKTGGNLFWLHQNKEGEIQIPPLLIGKKSSKTGLYFSPNQQSRFVEDVEKPIFSGWVAVLCLMGVLFLLWYREA